MKTLGPILGLPVEQGEIALHWLNRILRFFAGVQNDNRDVKRVGSRTRKMAFLARMHGKPYIYARVRRVGVGRVIGELQRERE